MKYYMPTGAWPLQEEPYRELLTLLGWQPVSKDSADVLVLPGGSDIGVREERDWAEAVAYHDFVGLGKPVIGICRGMQLMLYLSGADIIKHIPDETVEIKHTTMTGHWRGQSSWHSTEAGLLTNSRHHQGFTSVPTGWEVLDKTSDGIIEAVRRGNQFAVQWHPEHSEMINTIARDWWVEQVKAIL